MSLMRTNQREQMAKRLKQDLEKLAPEFSVAPSTYNSEPLLSISDNTGVVALAWLKPRSFEGYNIVAELSSDAGQGYPETELWLDVINSTSLARMAKLVKAATHIGASSFKLLTSAAPATADLVDANVVEELPNDPRIGASGT